MRLLLVSILVLGGCTGTVSGVGPGTDGGATGDSDVRPPPPPPPPPGDALYDVGALPAGMEVQWPALPETGREVVVRTAAEFTAAASEAGTRLRVEGSFGERVYVRASNIDIEVAEGMRLGSLMIERGHGQVRIRGGQWTEIELQVPASFHPVEEWRPEWLVHDVVIDGVSIDAPDSALLIRGRRVAILNSYAHAVRYSMWCGETDDFQSEDIVVANVVFESDGPESTLRLVQVLRSITVDSTLRNGNKHNYRVHGRSDLNFAARNTLVTTGVMLGTLPGDALNRVWFNDNVLHHTSPSLLVPDPAIASFESLNNVIYSDVVGCWLCGTPPSGWRAENNEILPYQPPP
ncbi:MAG: hypothetical protein RLP09_14895 [Sandaracinaceae bacterium]|nr:hypothetical protein [Myxococcales bacterium]